MNKIKDILNKITGKSEKKEPEFFSYYLFGLSKGKPIWNWENWKKCITIIQPIIDLSPGIPFIKTEQSIPVTYGKNNQYLSYNKGGLRFGRMIWNEKNNEKWTTKYSSEKKWTFFDTEISFPTRSNCAKNNIDPELFITINNENLTESRAPLIDQAITIHIRTHLIDKSKLTEIEKSIFELADLLNCKIAGKIKRPSSYKSDIGIGYTDSFWDGSYGVLNINKLDFSDDYKRYGIEKI